LPRRSDTASKSRTDHYPGVAIGQVDQVVAQSVTFGQLQSAGTLVVNKKSLRNLDVGERAYERLFWADSVEKHLEHSAPAAMLG
jgi:hypothetical protein